MDLKNIKLAVGIPSYGMGTVASFPLQCLSGSKRIEHLEHLEQSNSLLAANCNMLWTKALNGARRGALTHFLMVHSDVRPRANVMPGWFDRLLAEMELVKADVMAAIIPIKNTSGYTSTALDTCRWSPQRLTQHQINRELPETWTTESLLFNTGLMLVDLRGSWTTAPPFFTINDEIVQDTDGDWQIHCEPEDWNFSRMCRERGMSCFVTRVVPVDHFGTAMWSSDGVWGHQVDPECDLLSQSITVTGKNSKQIQFAPAQDRTTLPEGWFDAPDINFYRDIFSQLVPAEGQVVEVGSYRGRSLLSVGDIVRERNISVKCVDLFEPYLEDKSTTRLEEFIATITNANLEDRVVVEQNESVRAAARTPYGSLDFVFIDADHSYEAVKADIKAWLPRLKKGAWIGGHDFNEEGVNRAVMETFREVTGRPDSSIWLARRT